MASEPDEHALKTEARGLMRWLRRRWWVVWLVLLAQSMVAQSAHRAEREQERAGPGFEFVRTPSPGVPGVSRGRVDVTVTPGVGGRGPERVALSLLYWPDGQSSRKSRSGAAQQPQALPLNARGRPAWTTEGVVPVVLLHGSPGRAADFMDMAGILAGDGRQVLAPDMPGFGESEAIGAGYSIRSHAHAMIALLDTLEIRRVHLVGWSMGGGVALNMIDLLGDQAQTRVASLTLMASLGVQEGEGSGSYWFEHFKYGAAFAGLVVAPELVPHFGALGDRRERYAFVRNFWDTDQRPLRGIMERTLVPTLVLHGRHDVLVPVWVAEESHRLIATSRLVTLDANHFLPLLQAAESAAVLEDHFARHDAPGVPARTDVAAVGLERPATGLLAGALERSGPVLRAAPWWLELATIAGLALAAPVLAGVIAGVLGAHQQLDPFLAVTAVGLAWLAQHAWWWARGRRTGAGGERLGAAGSPDDQRLGWAQRLDRHALVTGWSDFFVPARRARAFEHAGRLGRLPPLLVLGRLAAMAAGVFCVVMGPLAASVAGAADARRGEHEWRAWAWVLAGAAVAWAGMRVFSRAGRLQAVAAAARLVRHEYWPAWVWYLPLAAWALARAAARGGGLMSPSCCNPGIGQGGGAVGESKHAIMAGLARGAPERLRGAVVTTRLVAGGDDVPSRAAALERLMRDEGLEFPVVLKPDEGQRGHAVRVVRSREDAVRFLSAMRRPAVVQPWCPGPCECGILWARHAGGGRARDGRAGFIFSITRKEFAFLVGDGRRTLEELIDAHPRHRCQAGVYLARLGAGAWRVPRAGERVSLGLAGNHCQGTLFRDGADLITPQLERAIDDLASSFPAPGGGPGGLDFGRFDVRYASDDALRAGREFQVIELNGTLSESTNMYDPARSLAWAYSVLFAQWRLLYALGDERLAAGACPITLRRLIGSAREHFALRDGPPVAD